MNQLIYSNPCIRCGKQRIVSKIKKENIGGSHVTTTIMSCPDIDCQRQVNRSLAVEREKREKMLSDFQQREKERKVKILKQLHKKRGRKPNLHKN